MYCIETSLENQSFFDPLVEAYPENFIIMKKNNFILEGDNLQIFIALSPVVIIGVCQVIVALINAQKEFSFKDSKSGEEYSFKGFSENKIYELINNLSKTKKK